MAEDDDSGSHKIHDGQKREVDEVHEELGRTKTTNCKYLISVSFGRYCFLVGESGVGQGLNALGLTTQGQSASYLGANVQCQASLVGKYQDDDALQNGA